MFCLNHVFPNLSSNPCSAEFVNNFGFLIWFCTALVVGSDDVASSYYMGVLDGTPGWQKGRESGGSCSRQLLSWRAPISSIPKLAVTRLKRKPPDVNPGDQVIRDRRRWRQIVISQLARGWGRGTAYLNIYGEAGRADHEGGWRDHREGVYEGTRTRHPEEITLQGSYALSCIMHK